ncbi:HAD family hydrolase [Loktanella agnita]|uniref:HAD family hydrolase n=1 Tax=Loktanella agnita TaxID=287097 RepID=UPI0039896206
MTAALLFDLDGTLLHSDPLHEQVFFDLMQEYGVHLAPGTYLSDMHGRQNAAIFADFLPDGDAQSLSDRKEAMFRERLGAAAKPTAGLMDLLALAKQNGWVCAVVTNAPRINADAMLSAIGLSTAFDTLVIGDECSAGKPDPAPYLEALARLGTDPATAIAFEDSPSGILAARAAGLFTYGLRTSLSHDQLTQAGASATLADFTDTALLDHLKRLEGATP